VLALVTADLVFAEKQRVDFHIVSGKKVPRFPRESRVEALRKKGLTAYSVVSPQHLAFWRNFVRFDSVDLYPLAGISRVTTYLCTEGDTDVLYRSDEHGFNNPEGIWNRQIDLAIIGDSFAHGVCVPPDDQVATLIRKSIPATVNAGILGTGPIAELALLREYLVPHRPRVVTWMFYEGNDLDPVGQDATVTRYLDSTFSQNLIAQQALIDRLLRDYEDRVTAAPVERGPRNAPLASVLKLRHLRVALGLGLRESAPPQSAEDYEGLEKSLTAAKREVSAWGGRMYFVYLPDSHRFDGKGVAGSAQHDDSVVYSRTLEIARKLGLPVIDLLPVFSADRDPKRFWYRPMSHYTPAGMRIVAQTMLARLTNDGVTATQ